MDLDPPHCFIPLHCQYGIRLLRLEVTLLENLTDSLYLTTLYTSQGALQQRHQSQTAKSANLTVHSTVCTVCTLLSITVGGLNLFHRCIYSYSYSGRIYLYVVIYVLQFGIMSLGIMILAIMTFGIMWFWVHVIWDNVIVDNFIRDYDVWDSDIRDNIVCHNIAGSCHPG